MKKKKNNSFIIVMFFVLAFVSIGSTAVTWKRIDEITQNTESLIGRLALIEDDFQQIKVALKNGTNVAEVLGNGKTPKKRIDIFEKKIKALEKLIQSKSFAAGASAAVGGLKLATGMKTGLFCNSSDSSTIVIEFSKGKKLRSWEVESLETGKKRVGDKEEATYALLGDRIAISFTENGLERKKRGFVESVDENDEVVVFSINGDTYSISACPSSIK